MRGQLFFESLGWRQPTWRWVIFGRSPEYERLPVRRAGQGHSRKKAVFDVLDVELHAVWRMRENRFAGLHTGRDNSNQFQVGEAELEHACRRALIRVGRKQIGN